MSEDIEVSDQAKNNPVYSQIATDAIAYGEAHCIVHPRHHVEFAAGAIHQDPIAWNRCLDEVMKIMDNDIDELSSIWNMRGAAILQRLKEELEKLRR